MNAIYYVPYVNKENKGPKCEPCGTPDVTLIKSETNLLILTAKNLLKMNDLIIIIDPA